MDHTKYKSMLGISQGRSRRSTIVKPTVTLNKNKSNTSGYTGVILNKTTGKYIARVTLMGKRYCAGQSHDTAELAADARVRLLDKLTR